MNTDMTAVRNLSDVIYHAQLAIRYAIICQTNADKETFYSNMLLDEVAALNRAMAALNYTYDPAYLQCFPRENDTNAATN